MVAMGSRADLLSIDVVGTGSAAPRRSDTTVSALPVFVRRRVIPEKQGGRVLSATAEKNTRTPKKILVENGRMLCPYCKSYLGRAVYGAKAAGIEVFCKSSRCHRHLRIEL